MWIQYELNSWQRMQPRHHTDSVHRRTSSLHIYLSPFLSDVLCMWWEWTTTCLHVWHNLLSGPAHLSDSGVLRLSIIALLCHHTTVMNGGNSIATTTWMIWLSLFLLVSSMTMREDVALASALVMLFLLEALQPVMLITCTSLLVWKQATWTTGLVVTSVLWAILAGAAHWIRCTLYHSTSHHG